MRGARLRVMVVDDSRIARLLLTQTRGAQGMDVAACASGAEALAMLAADPDRLPDVILMDMEMPEMDGLETTRQIRRNLGLVDLPIIAMTANELEDDRARSLAAGMNSHIHKTIEPEALVAALEQWSRTMAAVLPRGADAAAEPDPPVREGLPEQLGPFDVGAALRRANGNSDLLRKLIALFEQTYGGALNEIEQLLRTRDLAQAQRLAHSLRGVASTLEIRALPAAAGAIESALREGRSEAVPELLPALRAALEPALAAAATLGTVDAARKKQSERAAAARARVLVVDDDRINTELVADIFGQAYQVLCASTGEQALDIAVQEQPDLILLDVMMPGMDGYEICRRLKASELTAAIPVIFVTALEDVDAEMRGLELGAIDYVTKPFSPPVVRTRVKNHIDLKRAREQLSRLATSDGLTGLANRRYFDEMLEREWTRHNRSGGELSLVLLDIDHFKAYNDTYGHLAGDDCLRRVARAVGECVGRVTDVAARYGGEEFVCLLPETSHHGAVKVAERIREAVAALALPHAGSATAGYVTASLGVATGKFRPEALAAELLAAADARLYEAKEGGRNRVGS